jgi:GH25 family lysozyme M1 (1,4-beta-N-acetylmuramidase)
MYIFISYRRDDSADVTGRIYDRLVAAFGREAIFKDVDNIPMGVNFKEYLGKQVLHTKVMLAVIGPKWLTVADKTGARRLDNPADFVRIEVETGLQRKIPVIPLLVSGASMPHGDQLPSSLQKLSFQNGTHIRPDPDFHRDMDRLIKELEKIRKKAIVKERKASTSKPPPRKDAERKALEKLLSEMPGGTDKGIEKVISIERDGEKLVVTGAEFPKRKPDPPNLTRVVGIDISKWTKVQWARLDRSFVAFAFIKATEGTNKLDPEFEKNWSGAKAAGIIRGAYHYFHPDQDAAAQATYFLQHVRLANGDLPPVLDIESVGLKSKAPPNMAWQIRTWLELIGQMTGYKSIIYTNSNFWNSQLTGEFGEYPLWVAAYGTPSPASMPKGWKNWTFWQFTEQATVAGVDGPVDTTMFNGSYKELEKFVGKK